MIEKIGELAKTARTALRFAALSWNDPSKFVAEFFAQPEEQQWTDVAILFVLVAASQIAALSVGTEELSLGAFQLGGVALAGIAEIFLKTAVAQAVIRRLGGAAPLSSTLHAIAFPQLVGGFLGVLVWVLFVVSQSIAFLALMIPLLILAIRAQVRVIAALHSIRWSRALVPVLAVPLVLSLFSLSGPRVPFGLTMSRNQALAIEECMGRGEARLRTPHPSCVPADLLTLEDGGRVAKIVGDGGELPIGSAEFVGHGAFCRPFDGRADLARGVKDARVCIEAVKVSTERSRQAKRDALLFLDALETFTKTGVLDQAFEDSITREIQCLRSSNRALDWW